MNHAAIGWLLFLAVLTPLQAAPADEPGIRVELLGIEPGLAEKIIPELTVGRQQPEGSLTAARVKSLYRRARGELDDSMKARGYYKSWIEGSISKEERWIVRFDIDPGPPTFITDVETNLAGEGTADGELVRLFAEFPLSPSDQLDHGAYETGKLRIENAARSRGYLDAAWVTNVIEIDRTTDSARITLHYDSGPRYRFGDVSLPDTVVNATVLGNLIPFQPGDPYDLKKIIQLQQELRDSDYFSEVGVEPVLEQNDEKTIPVQIHLTPRPRNSYRIGGGFGTDTGPRLTGGWDIRYLNPAGHRIENLLRVSPVLSSLTSSYLLPFFGGKKVELGIFGNLAREDTDTSQSDSIQVGIQRLTTRWGWNETLSLSNKTERFKVGGETTTSNLLLPGAGYWRAVADDPIYTRKGYRLGVNLQGALEGFLSDVSFLQATLQGKYIVSPGDSGRLILRGLAGTMMVSDFSELPATLRFFAGGDTSIRGFDFESLGPRNAEGDVIGGRHIAVGSIEFEQHVRGNWSAAVFSDFGNAFNDFNDSIEYSVGAGVRWRSPVGLVRVDLATGISDDDLPIRLHIVVGPDL